MNLRRAATGLGAGAWSASAVVHGLLLAGAWMLLASGPLDSAPAPAYRPLDVEWLASTPAPVAHEPGPAAAPALPRPERLPQRRSRATAAVPANPTMAVPVAPVFEPAPSLSAPVRPLPVPAPLDAAEPVAAVAAGTPTPDSAGRPPAIAQPAGRESGAAAAPAPATRDDAYARWRQSFEQALQRDKRYPPSARRMGQSGTVWVQLTLAPDGGPQRIAVVNSSGFRSLDEAAEQLVRRVAGALQASHPPGRATELRIPIVYELTES